MRIAVHHLRRWLIKRAGLGACLTFPHLRSSMMTGVIGTPACPRATARDLRGSRASANPVYQTKNSQIVA
jgi:hypothetical protein